MTMTKLISLNTWGGRVAEPLNEFVRTHRTSADIFCFQEMHTSGSKEAVTSVGERPDFFEELEKLLPEFTGIFSEQVPGTGLATFVRKTIEVESIESHLMLSSEELDHLRMNDGVRYYPRITQVVRLKDPRVAIFNFHGMPGSDKRDTPERDIQMARLHEVLDRHDGEKILVGDFNLRPDTKAIYGIEEKMRNLVIEGGFTTTRTALYEKKGIMPFADYAFVSQGIDVDKFEVLQDEISDHSPLYLEFKIAGQKS